MRNLESASACVVRGRRFVIAVALLVAFLAALGGGSPAWAAVAVDTGPADAVLIAPQAFANADALVAAVEATGVRADIAYVPLVVVARADAGQADQLAAAGFTVLRAGDTAPDGAPAEVGRGLALLHTLSVGAVGAAAPAAPAPHREQSGAHGPSLPNDLRQWRAIAGAPLAVSPAASPGAPAGLTSPGAALSYPAFASSLPGADDVNAYALGTVVVSVIFTQSSGTSPKWPSTENWSNTDLVGNPAVTITDRRAYILSEVDRSLEWWVQRYAENGYSGHPGLTFVVPAAGQPGAPQTVATTIEPIQWSTYSATKPYFSDWLWRRDVMRHLGFPANDSDSPPSERAYDNWLRHQTGADWAITVYCVDSLRDEQTNWGYFKDGSVAYTYDLFGPYVVTSYANDGYGPENYHVVLAHEFGHVFGALDEYAVDDPSYPSGGSLTSGYLGVRNSNAQTGGTTNFPCIMRGGTDSMYAFAHGSLCPSTRGQDGWRDTDKDGDGRPDPVDTHPSIVDQPQSDALSTDTVTVAGTIGEVPRPHGKSTLRVYFKHDISILMPHDALYRLDGGLWQPLAATDGSWDEQTEGFTLTTPSLAPGPHQLQVRATTGEIRTMTRTIWVGDVPVSLGLGAPSGGHALTITAGQHATLTVTARQAAASPSRISPASR